MAEVVERAPLTLIACEAGQPLAERVAAQLRTVVAPSRDVWFACGEGKHVIDANVRGTDVYVVQSLVDPGSTRSIYDRFIMLLHAIEAASLADAQDVTAVVPYFPGARQDKRKGRAREGISAGLFARCLQEAGARRVVAVEVHNPAIAGMFDASRCRLEDIQLHPTFGPWLREQGLNGELVASPDVGGLERARYYAEDLAEGLVVLSKLRDYRIPNHVVASTLIGDVSGRDVLLVDDIIDTAGSVAAAVRELKQGGARNITVACAHPVLSGPAWERLDALADLAASEGWRFRVVGTSSIEHRRDAAYYRSFDLAPLLSRVVRSINLRGSVTGAQRGR